MLRSEGGQSTPNLIISNDIFVYSIPWLMSWFSSNDLILSPAASAFGVDGLIQGTENVVLVLRSGSLSGVGGFFHRILGIFL